MYVNFLMNFSRKSEADSRKIRAIQKHKFLKNKFSDIDNVWTLRRKSHRAGYLRKGQRIDLRDF